MSPRKYKLSRGFTLIELMITLAIFAIIVAIAAPGMNGFIVSSRLTGQANDLLAAFNLARSEAVRRNQRVILCPVQVAAGTPNTGACHNPGTGAWQGWMVFVDANSNGACDNCGADDGEELVRAGVMGGGDTSAKASESLSSSNNLLVFRPDGIAKADGSQAIQQVALRICDTSSATNQNARDIVLTFGSRMGVSRVSDSTCANPSNP